MDGIIWFESNPGTYLRIRVVLFSKVRASMMSAFLCCALLPTAGCNAGSGGSGRRKASTEKSRSTTAAEGLSGRPQVGVLRLPHGPSAGHFKVTALPPPQHTWNVQVAAPARADVGVRIRTWYGQPLNVLNSTRDKAWCKVSNGRSICFLPFPYLEAQRAGVWTVIVSKRSKPPATVRVVVTFNGA